MTLTLAGAQLYLFLGLIAALILLVYAAGGLDRHARGYARGLADQPPPRPCRRCRAAQLADTVVDRALDLDLLEAALEIVERQQAAAWAADPVLRGRLLELEIIQMADAAEQRIGRLARGLPR